MKIKELKAIDVVYSEVEDRIDTIKNKKRGYNTLFISFRVLTLLGSAYITLASASEDFRIGKHAIVLTSTLITLFAAIEGLFSFKNKAMSYDIFLYELRLLRNEIVYDYSQGDEVYKANRNKHFAKLQEIMGTTKKIIETSFDGKNIPVNTNDPDPNKRAIGTQSTSVNNPVPAPDQSAT